MTHTPGPWVYKQKYSDHSGSVLGADGRGIAAIASSVNRRPEEKLANSKLLSAAPDLLAALIRILDEYHGVVDADRTSTWFNDYPEVVKARNAIAKATGSQA